MAKIIVTGGAGFIGSHLTDQLIALGNEVIVVDNLMLGKKEFVNKKAKLIKADIRNYKKLKKVFVGAQAVFHLAADPRLPLSIEDPITTNDINVNGALNVLEAARVCGVKKVIFSSTSAVYGDQAILPIKESMEAKPLNPYGLHKLIGEKYCQLYSQLFGISTVCLRYFNVFGPRKLNNGSYPMVIPVFLGQKKQNQPLTIIGDGEATRDYVHVSDVVAANILAWQSPVSDGRAFNIGSSIQISVNTIARLIGGATTKLPERKGEMRYSQADISLAKEQLAWSPKVNFETGLLELKEIWGIK